MSQDNELRRLELFVEKLLARFAELQAEKTRLLKELRECEVQIEEMHNALSSRDMERGEISQRVSKIVEQIEEWEMGLEEVEVIASGPSANEDIEVDSEVDSQQSKDAFAENKSEEEGRVQQNLFSIGNTHR